MPGIEDSLDHLAAAVHEIDDAWRQVKGVQFLKGDLLRQRHLLRRLENNVLPHAIAKGRNQNSTIAVPTEDTSR
jgi:hypothetical protein